MGKGGTPHPHHNGNAQPETKRQRREDAAEQRRAFEEDMARVRSLMNTRNNGTSFGVPSLSGVGGNGALDGRGGFMREGADGSGRPSAFTSRYEGLSSWQQYQARAGESTLQQRQLSGESTLQQQQQPAGTQTHNMQPHRSRQSNSSNVTDRNAQRSTCSLESEDEQDGRNNWLQNFTPRRHTRVGENYQVMELPIAPSRAAAVPAARRSYCVSPGESSGE